MNMLLNIFFYITEYLYVYVFFPLEIIINIAIIFILFQRYGIIIRNLIENFILRRNTHEYYFENA